MANASKEFIVSKRSKEKDYCPGFIDLAAGGIVGMNDLDPDQNAKRELEEELGITSPDPEYIFKFKYSDENTNVWSYVYF